MFSDYLKNARDKLELSSIKSDLQSGAEAGDSKSSWSRKKNRPRKILEFERTD